MRTDSKVPEGYKQSTWEPVTAFNQAIEVVGARCFRDRTNERFIIVFCKVLVKGREELAMARFNINKARWDEEQTILETARPLNSRTLIIKVVQSFHDDIPPQVLIQGGISWYKEVYSNMLNRDGTAWANDDWENIV